MLRLLVHFARYGPYHHARLRSAAEELAPFGWEVIGLETAGTDATYAWDETKGAADGLKVVTAFPGRVHEEISAAEHRRVLSPLLDALAPNAMVIAGWGSTDAQLALAWCRKHDVLRIVMSETREADGRRVWWKERIKRYLISRFDGALVGGRSHRDYLVKLGMPADKIRFGYNVVDNAYFAAEAEKWRVRESGSTGHEKAIASAQTSSFSSPSTTNSKHSTSSPYFLASNRFIARKNLARLVDAYALYLQSVSSRPTDNGQPPVIPWNLCLLGDGELKGKLFAQCKRLALPVVESAPWELSPTTDNGQPTTLRLPTVFFPGFRQIAELPRFYAHAGCFVHPALEEPWGLVINEAMACGLPILSSRNVGAAEELADEGVNGWTFDGEKVDEMTECLARTAALDDEARSALRQASRRILVERCPTTRFGQGLGEILRLIKYR